MQVDMRTALRAIGKRMQTSQKTSGSIRSSVDAAASCVMGNLLIEWADLFPPEDAVAMTEAMALAAMAANLSIAKAMREGKTG